MPAPIPLGEGLIARRLRAKKEEANLVRALLEAHEGLANLYGDGSGVLTLIAPKSREAELERLIEDLAEELPIEVLE